MFVCTQNLNEWSQKIPVAQALKISRFATKPDQPGHQICWTTYCDKDALMLRLVGSLLRLRYQYRVQYSTLKPQAKLCSSVRSYLILYIIQPLKIFSRKQRLPPLEVAFLQTCIIEGVIFEMRHQTIASLYQKNQCLQKTLYFQAFYYKK